MKLLEALVGGGQAPAGVGRVDDVVVDECGDVEQVERRGYGEQAGVVVGHTGGGDMAPVAERRAQPLPTGGGFAGDVEEGEGTDLTQLGGLGVEEPIEGFADR